jgi:hypothetical protein
MHLPGGQRDPNSLCGLDYMSIRNDVAFRIENDAGSDGVLASKQSDIP